MSGMSMAEMDMSGMDIPHQSDHPMTGGKSNRHEGQTLCPFAAAATAMATAHTAVLAVAMAVETGSFRIPDPPFVPSSTIVPTRLPRGPPLFA